MLTSIARWLLRPFQARLQGRDGNNAWPLWRRIVRNAPEAHLPIRDIDMLIATSPATGAFRRR
ncbi:hypothetical protein CH92_03770 [Stutzerimonas stutzeri]|uniref:Uncharacterized protein n=1 Tax=Stutzerimonas stutzeri TaxID=316 RepID=W8RZP1_STUST|nr:hypothetical protein CH92_03770 [Stutzerimonas stutzeri]